MVLLVIMLPDEDGLSILKKLRATPETRRIPVILVTAKTTEIDKVKGLESVPALLLEGLSEVLLEGILVVSWEKILLSIFQIL